MLSVKILLFGREIGFFVWLNGLFCRKNGIFRRKKAQNGR
jgi:hypothetical protein